MKNLKLCIILLLIPIVIFGGYFGTKTIIRNKKLASIKKGWYVEIIAKEINVRDMPSTKGEELGVVKKGELYTVVDVNTDSSIYYWYNIKYGSKKAWIASSRTEPWVNDVNRTIDLAEPEIKFKTDTYEVNSIDDINYKHLEIIEDTDDYKVTHIVYHEVNEATGADQYWILYTVTDGAGKSSSKLQKVEFVETPPEEKVTDFAEYKK